MLWNKSGLMCWGLLWFVMGVCVVVCFLVFFFFFQAEDGIRDAQESRGLGDVYKRQQQEHIL